VVDLAVMGANLARNRATREGNTVAVYNRSPGRTRTLIEQHPEASFEASESIAQRVRLRRDDPPKGMTACCRRAVSNARNAL